MTRDINVPDEAEAALFKKKIKELSKYKGRGTELISLYIPPDADRSTVMNQVTQEVSQSSNIKSPQTRKNVQGALRKIINFLKRIDFRIPETGLVVFCGNVSGKEGVSDIRLFTVRPIQRLRTKLYWCDSSFHLEPIKEMVAPSDAYGIIVIDKREATLALLVGKKYEVIGNFKSRVAGKTRAGGQSAHRFEQLREEAEKEFFSKVAERANELFLKHDANLKGMITAGPGITKNEFLTMDKLDHRIKDRLLGTLDVSYTDESGIREAMQQSDQLLKDAEVTKERLLINRFFEEVAKDDLAAYGEKEVLEAIEIGKASEVLVSEGLEWEVIKFRCEDCGKEFEFALKEDDKESERKELEKKCPECGSEKTEELEEIGYIDFLLEKARSTGAELRIISTETPEGEQFLQSFSGIGALLRYK